MSSTCYTPWYSMYRLMMLFCVLDLCLGLQTLPSIPLSADFFALVHLISVSILILTMVYAELHILKC